jgi:hypothetical protein
VRFALADITNKVLISIVRQVMPNIIARELVSVQPMTGVSGGIYPIFNSGYLFNKMYSIIETKQVDGNPVYSVAASEEVIEWVQETFVSGADYTLIRNLKGVWVDVNEDVLVLLKLKWA